MNVVPLQLKPGADLRRPLEAWQVIAKANHIFGFDGWQRQTTSIHCVSQAASAWSTKATSEDSFMRQPTGDGS